MDGAYLGNEVRTNRRLEPSKKSENGKILYQVMTQFQLKHLLTISRDSEAGCLSRLFLYVMSLVWQKYDQRLKFIDRSDPGVL